MTVRTAKIAPLKVSELADVLEALVLIYADSAGAAVDPGRVNWAHGELHSYLLRRDYVLSKDDGEIPF